MTTDATHKPDAPARDADQQKQMIAALGRVPSGLFVLTMRRDSAETGMLTSWVQQCSFTPPQITVALKRGREIAAWLADGALFTLNILESGQTDMVAHFGRGFDLDEPAFEGLDVLRDEGSGPVLSEALAWLDCRVAGRLATGDHDLLLAEVVGGRVLGEGQPMTHSRKNGSHY